MDNIENSSMRDFVPQDETVEVEGTDVPSTEVSEGVKDSVVQAPETVQTPEQTFANTFDPSKLPPELQVAYKQMQGDYTKKTQELAGVRKFHDTYSKYETLLNYISQNPQLAEAYITGKTMTPGQAVTQPEVQYSDDPIEFARQVREESKKEAMAEFMNFYNQEQQRQQQEAQLENDVAEAETVDPRLATDESFADQVAAIVLSDPEVSAGNKSYVQATREAIVKVDSYTNAKIEAEKRKLTQMAKEKKSPIATGSPTATVEPGNQPKTMREAAAEFLK